MHEGLKRLVLWAVVLWTSFGQMARAVRVEPWSFYIGSVHVHPFPLDVRFQATGFDAAAFALGLAVLSVGGLYQLWRATRHRRAS